MPSEIPSAPAGAARNHTPQLLIFLTVLIDLIGFGIVIPVLPVYAENMGAKPADIAIILGSYSLMQFLFAPVWGKLSDRFGRRPILLISVLGTAVGFLLMGCASAIHSIVLLYIARIFDGICGANISTAQAYLADITAPENRAKAMGIVGAAFGLGFVFGPAMGGILAYFNGALPFYVAAAMALANTVFIYLKLPESLPKERRDQSYDRRSVAHVVKEGHWDLPRLLATYFFAISAFTVMTSLFALYASGKIKDYPVVHRMNVMEIGLILAMVGVIGLIIQGKLIGGLTKRFGEKTLAIAGACILAVFLFLLQLSVEWWSIMLVMAGIALGNSLVTPSLNSLASRGASPKDQGQAMGYMASAGSLARVFGAFLTGFALIKPFWIAAFFMLPAIGLMFLLHQPGKKDAEEPKGPSEPASA